MPNLRAVKCDWLFDGSTDLPWGLKLPDGREVAIAYVDPATNMAMAGGQSVVAGAGVGRLVGDAVESPPANLSSAVGTAGVLTGAYYYTNTFVTATGETAPWPGTATVVNPAAQRVNLSAIPLGPAGTTARRIYRTPATPTDPKDYRFLTQINDNTTTTYVDNIADGSLGNPVNWSATNRGVLTDGNVVVLSASDQSTAVGYEAFNNNVGYASTAIGYQTLYSVTSGRRNTAVGVYALTALTTGYECTGVGVHALDSLTTGTSCAAVGVSAGASNTTGNFLTAFGAGALQQCTVGGATAIGYRAGFGWTTGANGIAIGRQANLYSNTASEFWLDTIDRTNLAGQQAGSLMWGVMSSTVSSQRLTINALVKHFTTTVATLPAAAGLAGFRAFVTDANATTFASIVVGGGSNGVPVYCDGTNWRIG